MTAVNRKIIIIVAVGLLAAAMLHIVSRHYCLARAKQECLPYKIWLIKKNMPAVVGKGDYVYFHGKDIPLFGEKTHIVKRVSGTPGDIITVQTTVGPAYEDVTIENRKYRLQVKADITVTETDGTQQKFRAFVRNRDGKDLPFVYAAASELSIPPGHFYVTGDHGASYDSRYWGLLNEKNVIGIAYPLF